MTTLQPRTTETRPPDAYALQNAELLLARETLRGFIRLIDPSFVMEEVHILICLALEASVRGEPGFDRIMISMPPRTGKSRVVSVFFVAWYFGKAPRDKVMSTSHSIDLVSGHAAEVAEIMRSDVYRMIFPEAILQRSTGKHMVLEAGSNDGTQAGSFFGAGVGAGIAGKGFNLGIIDDPHSEQTYKSKLLKDKIWNWYSAGFYTRRQPERNIIIVMATRWAYDDLPGRLLDQASRNQHSDQWMVLNIPAILDQRTVHTLLAAAETDEIIKAEGVKALKPGVSFAPRRFDAAFLRKSRAVMTERDWNAQYMGRPSEDEGSILLSDHFRLWVKKDPPECVLTASFWDTALEDGDDNDYTARLTLGLFERSYTHEGREFRHLQPIMLEAKQERLKAAYLRDRVTEHQKIWQCDRIVIEKKASGIQLIQELQLQHPPVPVEGWLPSGSRRLSDKVARANLSSIVLSSCPIWYMDRQWAADFISQCLQFPYGQHDDWVDTLTMAVLWMRRHGLIQLPTDEMTEDEDLQQKVEASHQKKRRYYG
jgi:predicted phage terminase large subunit-like protein